MNTTGRGKVLALTIALLCASVAAIATGATPASAASTPIDLRTWTQEGKLSNGNWIVSSSGASVLQTINGNPTFFVSPTNMTDTIVRGTLRVAPNWDDDLIGFVFGYRAPLRSNGDDVGTFDTYVFDWKQETQDASKEGFALYRLTGGASTTCFWARTPASCANMTLLGTSYGSDRGWVDGVTYTFELLFTADQIRITIQGGTGVFRDGVVVFDVSGEFVDGRFGFYNYSQEGVTYAGFTTDELPVPVIAPVAPAECVDGGASVTLDGSSSYDADGDPLTFAWSAPGVAFDDATSPQPTGTFPLGTTRATLALTAAGATVTASVDVLVHDTTAPTVEVARPASGAIYVDDEEIALGIAPDAMPLAVGPLTLVAFASDACATPLLTYTLPDGTPATTADGHVSVLYDPSPSLDVARTFSVVAADAAGHETDANATWWHAGTHAE